MIHFSPIQKRRTYFEVVASRRGQKLPEGVVDCHDEYEFNLKAPVITVTSKGIIVRPWCKQILNTGFSHGDYCVITRVPGSDVVYITESPLGLSLGIRRGQFFNYGADMGYIRFAEGFGNRYGLTKGQYEYLPEFCFTSRGMHWHAFRHACSGQNLKSSSPDGQPGLKDKMTSGEVFFTVANKLLYMDYYSAVTCFAVNANSVEFVVSTADSDNDDNRVWVCPNNSDKQFGHNGLRSDPKSWLMYCEVPPRAFTAGLIDGHYRSDKMDCFEGWGYHRLLNITNEVESGEYMGRFPMNLIKPL